MRERVNMYITYLTSMCKCQAEQKQKQKKKTNVIKIFKRQKILECYDHQCNGRILHTDEGANETFCLSSSLYLQEDEQTQTTGVRLETRRPPHTYERKH